LVEWISSDFSEAAVRASIGRAAKKGRIGGGEGWFKNVTLGIEVGGIVARSLRGIAETRLAAKLTELGAWIYA
jgi:hypothetical protein